MTAEFHLAMATLIEAEAEDDPDHVKIKELEERVNRLRAALHPAESLENEPERERGQGRGPGHGQRLGRGQFDING